MPAETALDFDIPCGLVKLVEHPCAFVLGKALNVAGEAIVDSQAMTILEQEIREAKDGIAKATISAKAAAWGIRQTIRAVADAYIK